MRIVLHVSSEPEAHSGRTGSERNTFTGAIDTDAPTKLRHPQALRAKSARRLNAPIDRRTVKSSSCRVLLLLFCFPFRLFLNLFVLHLFLYNIFFLCFVFPFAFLTFVRFTLFCLCFYLGFCICFCIGFCLCYLILPLFLPCVKMLKPQIRGSGWGGLI